MTKTAKKESAAEEAAAVEQHPSLSEAQAMFRENPGLAAVTIATEGGLAVAHRDGRVEAVPAA